MEQAEDATNQGPVGRGELQDKPLAEIKEVVARCRRLLAQPLVLSRLPGKEAELKVRLASHEAELESRMAACTLNDGEPSAMASSSARDQEEAAAAYDRYSRLMGEKYKHHRPSIEEEMRKSFNALLSDVEIKRRLSDIPNPSTFLMTYEETIAMEKESRARERQRELQRIRARREQAVKFEEAERQRVRQQQE